MYKIYILPQAQKDLDSLRGKTLHQIEKKIISLSTEPRPFGSIKLTVEEGYRLRCGDYRIIYRADDKEKRVYIYRIKQRKEAYR